MNTWMGVTTLAFAVLSCLPKAACAADSPSGDTAAFIKAVMDDQYGSNYDPSHGCWSFSHATDQGDTVDYCMRPGAGQLVDTPKGRQLYFYAANIVDIDSTRYAYGNTQPGLMGAFKILLDGKGGWTYMATENAMEFGTGGNCGCEQARFLKFSTRGDYGWLFASGGVWQGTVASDYDIVIARGAGFADISRVPQVKEGAQDVKYVVDLAAQPATNSWFPLVVTKTSRGGRTQKLLAQFNVASFAYELPADQR